MWMLRVYLPGTEETTITQAVPPGRRHSITLRGSIPAVIPNAHARVYLPGAEETTIKQAVTPGRRHSITLRGSIPAVIPNADSRVYLPGAERRPQSRRQFLQADAIPLHFGGQSLRSSLMRMPRVYLPDAEETTTTQAVPPGRRHSITLQGSILAVIPNADATGLPTWRRGDHNHAGSSSRLTPFHYTSGVNPCGHP